MRDATAKFLLLIATPLSAATLLISTQSVSPSASRAATSTLPSSTTGAPCTGAPSTGDPSTGDPSTGVPSTGVPSKNAQSKSTPATMPAFAAMAYYAQNCAHCHGPQGTFYGPTLGQKLTDEQLIKVIDDMASGPGNAPLTREQSLVETAFHRALIMRTPFVSVTSMGGDGKWSGETMPDAKVTIVIGDRKIGAALDDATWSATLPTNVTPSNVRIVAELSGATSTLMLADRAYSNYEPLPPPSQRPR